MVARRFDEQDLREVAASLAETRVRIADLAGSIADTEDVIAQTLEQMAEDRPDAAERLLAKADHARRFAAKERERAEQR
jgi:hypothetical protein